MTADGAVVGTALKPRRVLSIGITGHRPSRLDGCDLAALDAAIADLIERIAVATRVDSPGDICLVSSLAEGADSMVADAATGRGWRLEVVLPFGRDDYARDFPAGAIRDQHLARLARAAAVFELPGSRDGEDEAAAYERAGRVMLSQSDLLLAIWDGGPVRGRGGAAQIVAEAVMEGVPVIQVDPRRSGPARLLWDGLDDADLGQQTVETVARGDLSHLDRLVSELVGDASADDRDRLRFFDGGKVWQFPGLAYPALLALGGVRRPRPRDFRIGPPLVPDCSDLPTCQGEPRLAWRLAHFLVPRFARADQAATVAASYLRSGYVRNFSLAAFAVALSMFGLLLPHQFKVALLLAELATIVTILGGTHIGRRAGWHRSWLDQRALAERLRCLAITVQLGDLNLRGHGGAGGSWVTAITNATARELGLPNAAADAAYLGGVRQSLRQLIDSQRAYLAVEVRRMHRLEHRLHLAGSWLFALTALICLALLAVKLAGSIEVSARMLLAVSAASAMLPAIGAAIYGIRMQGDFAGIAERSAMLAHQLGVVRQVIDQDVLSFDTIARRARRTADLLSGDVARWFSNASVRPLVLPG